MDEEAARILTELYNLELRYEHLAIGASHSKSLLTRMVLRKRIRQNRKQFTVLFDRAKQMGLFNDLDERTVSLAQAYEEADRKLMATYAGKMKPRGV